MKVVVNRADLLRHLASAAAVAERKSSIAVLSHVLLRAESGRLSVAATDLDIAVRGTMAADVGEPGDLLLEAARTLSLVKSLPGDEVTLEELGGWRCAIRAGAVRFTVQTMAAGDYPNLPRVESAPAVRIDAAPLRRLIAAVMHAVSAEESRFQLNGANLRVVGAELEFAASDGHRLACCRESATVLGEIERGVVPRKALMELAKADVEGEVAVSRGAHHISWAWRESELVCRVLEGTFPDHERLMQPHDQACCFDRAELLAAAKRTALLRPSGPKRLLAARLTFRPGEPVLINTANPDTGESEQLVATDWDGERLEVGLMSEYLVDALAALPTSEVKVCVSDANSSVFFLPINGPSPLQISLVMPCRL